MADPRDTPAQPLSFADRAAEKQRAREADAAALASGELSAEELGRRNGHFALSGMRPHFTKVDAY